MTLDSFMQREAATLLDKLEPSLTPEGVERIRMILRGERVRNAKDFLAAARLALEFTAAKPAQAVNVQQAVFRVSDPYRELAADEGEALPVEPPRARTLPERQAEAWHRQHAAELAILQHAPAPALLPGTPSPEPEPC